MTEMKIMQVADPIHGPIQISGFEKQIISTQAFNRLHNILQNSTVYLTYPSNQTKRFVHSLGVMELTGKTFYHSIINSESNVRLEFLTVVDKWIQELHTDKDTVTQLKLVLGDKYIDLVKDYKKITFEDPLYRQNTPSVIGSDYIFAYTTIFQALRCAGLLHDFGHPPFSHITEDALVEVYTIITKIDPEKRTKRQNNFLRAVNYYLTKGKLHEQIGNNMTDRLLESFLVDGERPASKEQAETYFFSWLVHQLVKNIFAEKTSYFKNLHRLIDGPFDTDRLDYVTRDLMSSGVNNGYIEYERLIISMRLMKYKDNFVFCPSIRTLSLIEDFFQKRWFLYKYVVYHHRVVKTDYLLGKVIAALAIDYLQSQNDDSPAQGQVLPLDISGLWRAIEEVLSNKDFFNALIQWDDSWLITVLRKEFFSKYQSGELLVRYQLEELLSNRKHYSSIIKRMEDCLVLDRVVRENLKVDWNKVQDAVGDKYRPLLDELRVTDWNVPENGFFLNKLKEFFKSLDPIGQDALFESPVINAVSKICTNKYNLTDSIVVFKKHRTGLEQKTYIARQNEAIDLEEVSRIRLDLRQNQMVFPPFFIYIFGKDEKKFKQNDFLSQIGEEIAHELAEVFQTKIQC